MYDKNGRPKANLRPPPHQAKREPVQIPRVSSVDPRSLVSPYHGVDPMSEYAATAWPPSIQAAVESRRHNLLVGSNSGYLDGQAGSSFHQNLSANGPGITTDVAQSGRTINATIRSSSEISHPQHLHTMMDVSLPTERHTLDPNGFTHGTPTQYSDLASGKYPRIPSHPRASTAYSGHPAQSPGEQYSQTHIFATSPQLNVQTGTYTPNDPSTLINLPASYFWTQESGESDPMANGGINTPTKIPNEDQTLTLFCSQCINSYTGKYAPRNLDRHVKSKHVNPVKPCCNVCHKVYGRNDAVLKHQRDHHPELNLSPPIPRKKSDESHQSGISPTALDSE
ncbi:hypothetical protein K505DRAFT_332038 [Melanomma pulvis-pyrius CBS 109.77]|uniref:C2H2-type domain-containing protein n=1 Tax=Melanomma pulvis-pyrius CBS 109.77 TaxID=1314802 RepID=A0A6A6XWN0_9PLEO|nr:hypothetical protein K505DRAFT_332038 [Melanomma pulvis-pyrius CBS 109.77]